MDAPRYTPFYCEENVWHLCAARRGEGRTTAVVLVTNSHGSAALFAQRAAPPGRPVAWDYHVFLVEDDGAGGERVWDLDSRLGAPVRREDYLAATFAPPGALPARFEPRFLLVGGEHYLASFSSDRGHMRTRDGRYRKPPPPWPPILVEGAPSFRSWLDEGAPSPGRWVGLEELLLIEITR